MTQADSVHSTPPINTPIPSPGLAQQQRHRERALKRLAKLRKKAADEMEKLISFLDASDPYARARAGGSGRRLALRHQ